MPLENEVQTLAKAIGSLATALDKNTAMVEAANKNYLAATGVDMAAVPSQEKTVVTKVTKKKAGSKSQIETISPEEAEAYKAELAEKAKAKHAAADAAKEAKAPVEPEVSEEGIPEITDSELSNPTISFAQKDPVALRKLLTEHGVQKATELQGYRARKAYLVDLEKAQAA